MRRILLVLSAAALMAAMMAVSALPAFAQVEAKAGKGELPAKAKATLPEEKKELPKTGGASVVPIAAITMLIGSGVVGYSVLRSRRSG